MSSFSYTMGKKRAAVAVDAVGKWVYWNAVSDRTVRVFFYGERSEVCV